MDNESTDKKREIIAALAVLIVVVVIVGGIVITNKKKPTGSSTVAMTQSPNNSTTDTATYKDGSYMAAGSYDSPGGTESITVSVTLKNNTITDTTAKSGANDSVAEQYQNMFIAGYQKSVVGKAINSLKVSRVSGSSLTSQGFNDAIRQIKQQARA